MKTGTMYRVQSAERSAVVAVEFLSLQIVQFVSESAGQDRKPAPGARVQVFVVNMK